MKLWSFVALLCGAFVAQAQDDARIPLRQIGKADAPVQGILFSSFSCPHCRHFSKDIEPKLVKDYVSTGKVKLTFVEMAHDETGMLAIKLGRCVAPEKYYSFVSQVYHDTAWKSNPLVLQEWAGKLGMADEDIRKCLQDKTLESNIRQQQTAMAGLYNIRAVPTFIIVTPDGHESVIATNEAALFTKLDFWYQKKQATP